MHGRTHRFPAALATTLAAALVATACGSNAPSTPPQPGSRVDLRAVAVSAQQRQQLAAADAAFARSLWSTLAPRDGNIVLSPASIATALQMAYVGARGQTAAEMARTLRLGPNATPTDVAAAASRLLAALAPLAHDKKTLLTIADEVWLQKSFPVLADFRAAMTTGFGSAFELADFAGHPDDARREINDAVAAQTHDRIRDLLPAGTDLSASRLVLTNAIYLKAAWASPFEKSMTAPASFTRADGNVVRPQTMRDTGYFDFAAAAGYQAIRLPYDGDRLAMTLLLPAKGHPLTWPAAAPAYHSEHVDLELPKFKFSWEDDLAQTLGSLGMPTAFTERSDFGGMASTPLHIGLVRHKAFIAVDENGTEAAAATGVAMAGAAAAPSPVTSLRFDRPFLFSIDDTATGLPLFLGKVADPTLGG
jgi:serpin B